MERGKTHERPSARSKDSDEEPPKKKRALISTACNRCRSQKTKCDGLRPTCSSCAAHSHPCEYDVPRAGLRQANEALKLEVADLRRQVEEARSKSGGVDSTFSDRTVSLSTSRQRIIDLQTTLHQEDEASRFAFNASPSYHQTVRATLPYTQSPLEFELTCKHPNAYRFFEPYGPSEALTKALVGFDTSALQSTLATGSSDLFTSPFTPDCSAAEPQKYHHAPAPQAAIRLIDDRLQDLQVAYWTSVPISNMVAASILSLYLRSTHPVLGTFDADLFLNDLVARRLRFCSPFLVNAVLYFGCAYTVFDPSTSQLSWEFYAEAKKLWQADNSTDSIVHIAALMNMAAAGSSNGHDQEGALFLDIARKMAERLGLDDGSLDVSPLPRSSETLLVDDYLRFSSHVSWGYFVIMKYAFYYLWPPTRAAPPLPMPGSPGFPLPEYMGSTFLSICKFWSIVRECVVLYAGAPEHIAARVPIAAMETKYQQLLAFATNLEPEPDPKPELELAEDVRLSHHAKILHIWYHAAIINLMRPWLGKRVVLKTFDSVGSQPESVSAASLRQLKRHMMDFRLFYVEATYNIQWHPCLMFIANAALTNSDNDPEWQFYFMTCLYGYGVLSPAFRVAELCFKGLLTLAVDTGKMPAARAQYLLQRLHQRGEHHRQLHVHSGIRLKLDVGDSEGPSGTVEDLASRFESIVVHELDGVGVDKDEHFFDELVNFDGD